MKIRGPDVVLFSFALLIIGVALVVYITSDEKPEAALPELTKMQSLAPQPVTVLFSHYWRDELAPGDLESLIADFQARHPLVLVEQNVLSYSEMRDQIDSIVRESDVVALDPRWLADLGNANALEMLRPLGEESGIVWTRSLFSSGHLLFYDIEHLQNAGFAKPPKTRGEFLQYARALGASSVACAFDPESLYSDLYSWIWASGVLLTQNSRLNFTDPQVVEVFQFLNTLNSEGLITANTFDHNETQKIEAFCNGTASLMIAPAQSIKKIRERMGDSAFGVTTIPVPDRYMGKPVLGLSTWSVGLSRWSANKSAAGAFVDFLAEHSTFLSNAAGAIPGTGQRTSVDLVSRKAFDMFEMGELVHEFDGRFPAVRNLETIVRNELYKMFETEQSPAETVRAIQQNFEAIHGLWR
ncbi:sugar ABC transporter substrate-binding protein [Spirochaetia bacterium]|nr:sugar ABC transporter substrate-binding protein [Spirochaetia bacterium]